jgi:flagellar protein FlgJ
MPTPPSSIAGDIRSLDSLRAQAARDPKAAVREAAKAFETLFMQEVMKGMRSATLRSGMLDSEGEKLGTELLDQQMATRLAGMPGGLADMLARQLERQLGVATAAPGGAAAAGGAAPASPVLRGLRPAPAAGPVAAPGVEAAGAGRLARNASEAFVQQHTEVARRVERSTGLPAEFMIGQAALESGWGRREIRHADGRTAHNLFGIKAGAGWRGPVAEVMTTEYVDGQAKRVMARFRAYASYEESFADYARLMRGNPRYAGVIANGGTVAGFAENLQKAGYATDPAYADKLARVINTTLRLQRSLA